MRLIKVHYVDGDEIFVNVEYIEIFFSTENSNYLHTLEDHLIVVETPEEIIQLIKQAKEI
ncbi:flagellar FlbD family protein [Enterococcus cecorum]|uniref:flagellar FlbD family protein n=1 Tax=Enterococcus cecorum TaxID=44008 RepID=UPI000ADBD1CC|nr:flagellar FlbD family protein [Enterococcus cecorum]